MLTAIANFGKLSRFQFGLAVCLVSLGLGFSAISNPISARSYSIDRVDVTIDINADSTMMVTEDREYTYDGEYNGFRREITLSNETNAALCNAEPTSRQCGGLSFLNIESFQFNGIEVPKGRYELLPAVTGGVRKLTVEYKFDNAPVQLAGETYRYTLRYKAYGALGFFSDYDLFYWNAHTSERDVPIKKSTVTLNYPGSVSIDANSSKVDTEFQLDFQTKNQGNAVTYSLTNLQPGANFTIVQKLGKNIVAEPASLRLKLSPSSQTLKFKSIELESADLAGTDGYTLLKGLPAAEYKFEFSNDQYTSQVVELTLRSGETKELEVILELSDSAKLLLGLLIFCNICCCLLGVLAPAAIYFLWRQRGKDPETTKAVIPEFNPPVNVRPYLLGALKDEQVDDVDITATLIDLAYGGYLKIVETKKPGIFGGKRYTLEKLAETSGLDEVERRLMEAIFSENNLVELDTLKYKFYAKLPAIRTSIYQKMVSLDWYRNSPEAVHSQWLVIGTAVLIIGSILGVVLIFLGVITALLAAIITGICLIYVSKHMPVRTAEGVEVLRQTKGFRMYLETAEKYTIQNLTPETFEKFLPYAMVFGVEKQWAENFRDIYTSSPSWYQSSDGDLFTTLILVNSLNSFSNASYSAFTASPQSANGNTGNSTSSSFGGGSSWSGGGGFGGSFSGGGGGGGGEGSW